MSTDVWPDLEAKDFTTEIPEFATLTEEEWDDYVSCNIGRKCPAPGPGEEATVIANGWGSWRRFQALKCTLNWR